ncbi:hypothetical protein JOE61_003332 [Nocardioides salarius]|uniref:Fenitrothion hydrolase n=1 Tax=Nocardioides salarius TaxID=374513 RepID=A0ABS2ME97_9ACTN|nr:hypothetical protein [Nocardioides salarius]MBM7509518.1 hypothetical protein [Nocardioides salarius]
MLKTHGIGGPEDLPIPADLAIVGGAAALAVSFLVLLFAWRRPRYAAPANAAAAAACSRETPLPFVPADAGVPAPAFLGRLVDSRAFEVLARGAGLAFLAYVTWAAVRGPDLSMNPTFGVVFVLLWVGIVPASLLFGPFYRAINPARSIYLLIVTLGSARSFQVPSGQPDRRHRHSTDDTPDCECCANGVVGALPAWVGYWPAALALLCFVWFELVYPEANYLAPVRLWFAIYFALVVMGGVLFGPRWIARADPFEVYSTAVSRLSVWGRRQDGTLVLLSPLRNLATLPGEPGLVAVLSVLLGSTAFDSFRSWNVWVRFSQSTEANMLVVNTAVLTGMCAVVAALFVTATKSTGVEGGTRRGPLPGTFAHSLVPIIVGYITAHYLTLLVESGQLTLVQLSDPLGTGADLLGTATWEVNYWLSDHPTFLATTKVVAIVAGHVLGVIAAHDRALAVLPRRFHIVGQLPLLLVMVAYTFGGLYLLFGG